MGEREPSKSTLLQAIRDEKTTCCLPAGSLAVRLTKVATLFLWKCCRVNLEHRMDYCLLIRFRFQLLENFVQSG